MKGTAWISAARLLTNVIGFLSTLVLARVLGPADFGLVALATTMLAVLSSVTDLSLTSALVRHNEPTIDHYHTAWTLGFMRSAAIAVVFALIAIPAAKIYHEPRITGVIWALTIGVLISGLWNPRSLMLTKQLVFWQQFMLQVSQKLISLIVSVVVVLVFRSYWALVWGTLAGQAAGALISYMVLPFRPRLNLKHSRELFHFSVWLTLGQIVNTVNWKVDQLLIGGALGRTALGYYTVGDNLAAMPTREATAPITNTLFPAFSRLNDNPKNLAAAYQSAQALVTSIALPAGVGMALIADPLVRLAMGSKWLPAVFLIQALASVLALQTLGTLSQPLAMASGETRLLFRRDLQNLVIRLPFVVAGMLLAGMTGIICARILTGSLTAVLHMQVVKKITGLSLLKQIRANMRSLISVAIMAAAVLPLMNHRPPGGVGSFGLAAEIGIRVLVGGVAYIFSHILMWRAMGKPDGPEVEVAKIFRLLVRRFRPVKAVTP